MEKNKELMKRLFTQSEIDLIFNTKADIVVDLVSRLHGYFILRPQKYVVAGGAFTSLLHEEPCNDIDIFVLDTTNEEIEMFEKSINLFQQRGGKDEYLNGTQTTHIKAVYDSLNTNFQYILTNYKTRQEVIDNFDFVHSKISYYDTQLFITRQMFDANMNRKLIPNKPKEQINEKRWIKFKDRGFSEAVSI